MMKAIRRMAAGLAALCLLLPASGALAAPAQAESGPAQDGQETAGTAQRAWSLPWYSDIRQQQPGKSAAQPLRLTAQQLTERSPDTATAQAADGTQELLTGAEGYVRFAFSVPKDAWYTVRIEYQSGGSDGATCARTLTVDGAVPYREAYGFSLPHVWEDIPEEKGRTDAAGDELAPNSREKEKICTRYVYDASGMHDEPMEIWLSAGQHTLGLEGMGGQLRLRAIELLPPEEPASYAEVAAAYPAQNGAGERICIEAENIAEKSAAAIGAAAERGSAGMSPDAVSPSRLNCLSGGSSGTVGNWVTYTVDVAHSGLYTLSFKYRQNEKDGGFCSRRLLIDGSVPFAEAQQIRFPYSDGWDTLVFADGDGSPYLFYLEAGEHTLQLESVIGALAPFADTVQRRLQQLNTVYQKMYLIVGPEADPFRDYGMKTKMADELPILRECADSLDEVIAGVGSIAGLKSSFTTTIERTVRTLRDMLADPESIAERMSEYKSQLGAVADWVNGQQSQTVDLDFIELLPPGETPRKANAGFWNSLVHGVRLFLLSFTSSYADAGIADGADGNTEPLDVWLTSGGRDQAAVIRRLTTERFVPQEKIPVTLRLVSGSLMTATLAGIGPDVALFVGGSEPINYAVRGAAADLSRFADCEETLTRFWPESLVPYRYADHLYALPETVTFPMLFLRADIFARLGLSVPQTWDEVYDTIARLSAEQYLFAVGTDVTTYYMLLMQNGGSLYTDDLRDTALDNELAINTFTQWTAFFTDHSLPVDLSFINRFRTGEVAAGIADLTTANQLNVFAPEIRGMWEMLPVPGTVRADGTIDRTVVCSGTADMLMEQSDRKEDGWRFLKWWSDASTQSAYARLIEEKLGISARYPTANSEAFASLGWSAAEKRTLAEQRAFVRGIPEVPGSYIVSRYLTFTFRDVVNDAADAGEELLRYDKLIGAELARKREEFSDALAHMER